MTNNTNQNALDALSYLRICLERANGYIASGSAIDNLFKEIDAALSNTITDNRSKGR